MVMFMTPSDNKLTLTDKTRTFLKSIFEQGTPENTRRTYTKDIKYITAWMNAAGLGTLNFPVSISTVLQFITDHLGDMSDEVDSALVTSGAKAKLGPHSIATIKRRLATLSVACKLSNTPNPVTTVEVRETIKKATKALSAQGVLPRKKRAIVKTILDDMLTTCNDSTIDIRDRALLLFMAASGGRRRSEASAAIIEDLTEMDDGYIFHLRRSKTDQEGKGSDKPILGRAGRALKHWINTADIKEGPIFRPVTRWGQILETAITGASIRRIVIKRAYLIAKAEGLDDEAANAFASQFGAHSLRSGFVTEWGRLGGSRFEAMELTGHKSHAIFDGYYQAGNVVNNAAARIFD